MTNLFFAPYFEVSKKLFLDILIKNNEEFIVVPDTIDGDIPLVSLFNGNNNMNEQIMKTILEKTNFHQVL